ncbi:MAG: hypothetical protein QOE05_2483 [Actinomycetota bacterium]|jgi:hypothetical protein|nr:hypothetical protein [Actinomycetota bacterium]
MLTSISPLGERARGNRWGVTVTLYVVASLLGGLTTGALLGFAGSFFDASAWVAAVVCGVAAVLDVARRLPTMRRQVDEDWLTRYRGWVYGVGFGYQLGLGVVTIVTSAATYAMLALCLLSGSTTRGLVIGGCFGLVRALPILALRRASTPEALRAIAARLEVLASAAGRATSIVLAAAAVTLAVAG